MSLIFLSHSGERYGPPDTPIRPLFASSAILACPPDTPIRTLSASSTILACPTEPRPLPHDTVGRASDFSQFPVFLLCTGILFIAVCFFCPMPSLLFATRFSKCRCPSYQFPLPLSFYFLYCMLLPLYSPFLCLFVRYTALF
jgi:hypothetical protein